MPPSHLLKMIKTILVSDLIHPNDFVVLVVPIDKAAPKGRLILPQQQTIRDILDTGATAIVTRDSEFADTLNHLGKAPSLVITDSQVIRQDQQTDSAGHSSDVFLDFICKIQRQS